MTCAAVLCFLFVQTLSNIVHWLALWLIPTQVCFFRLSFCCCLLGYLFFNFFSLTQNLLLRGDMPLIAILLSVCSFGRFCLFSVFLFSGVTCLSFYLSLASLIWFWLYVVKAYFLWQAWLVLLFYLKRTSFWTPAGLITQEINTIASKEKAE